MPRIWIHMLITARNAFLKQMYTSTITHLCFHSHLHLLDQTEPLPQKCEKLLRVWRRKQFSSAGRTVMQSLFCSPSSVSWDSEPFKTGKVIFMHFSTHCSLFLVTYKQMVIFNVKDFILQGTKYILQHTAPCGADRRWKYTVSQGRFSGLTFWFIFLTE